MWGKQRHEKKQTKNWLGYNIYRTGKFTNLGVKKRSDEIRESSNFQINSAYVWHKKNKEFDNKVWMDEGKTSQSTGVLFTLIDIILDGCQINNTDCNLKTTVPLVAFSSRVLTFKPLLRRLHTSI